MIGCITLFGASVAAGHAAPASTSLPAADAPAVADQFDTTPLIDNTNNPLHLTADQQTKVDGRKRKFQTDAHYVAIDTTLTRDQKIAKISDLEKAAIADIKTYLTHDQRSQILAEQDAITAKTAERMAKIARFKSRQQIDAQDYKAQRQLLLQSMTKGQMKIIMALEDSTNASLAAVRADKTKTPPERDAIIAKIVSDHNDKQAAIFTPDQKVIVDRMNSISADAEEAQKQLNLMSAVVIPLIP